jgi:hypothetical protein
MFMVLNEAVKARTKGFDSVRYTVEGRVAICERHGRLRMSVLLWYCGNLVFHECGRLRMSRLFFYPSAFGRAVMSREMCLNASWND